MLAACGVVVNAATVTVNMNNVSPTMSLVEKESGTPVDIGEPEQQIYSFDAPAGQYVLTAYGTDAETVNGTIVLDVNDVDAEQVFSILTVTLYVDNKNEDGTPWTLANGDYTIDVKVMSREGDIYAVTVGNSVNEGQNTVLAFNGNTCHVTFNPGEKYKDTYMPLYRSGTLTWCTSISGTIPTAAICEMIIPADAEFFVGIKGTHYTPFTPVEPESETVEGDTKHIIYRLSDGQRYNFRTWKPGGLTQAGKFTGTPNRSMTFPEEWYEAYNPKQVNHDPTSNQGYETGDIFVNINPEGHLKMNVGDSFNAHAMRTWELTDTQIDNYFMEPDFTYTVVDLDGKPSTGVIEIENSIACESPWSKIKAVGAGTAIVLVTYDAISVSNYNNDGSKTPFMGGEYWGAIWQENTGVYVVTVGEKESAIEPNMVINEKYNAETLKLAGKYVDAEHDVFYYLDTEEGATYTFTPTGVADITIAYPEIGENSVSFSGFGTDGVTSNEDGSYTLLLKHGRQIVKMTDASGNSAYQVLTAKECHRELVNMTREGATTFQPGDQVKIQYSGLFHPANKLAGIYNMSAYVTYNGVPNGTSLILGSGQYTFGSAPGAQAVTLDIPELSTDTEIVLDEGVIQVNGYGDPIGNHRNIDINAGRSPNFTATAHKTYFGAIPGVRIPITPLKMVDIKLAFNVEGVTDADVVLKYKSNVLTPNENGIYTGPCGDYTLTVSKSGYNCYRSSFSITEDDSDEVTVDIELQEVDGVWDGTTLTEPTVDNGVYQISNGAELAWFANYVNNEGENQNAVLTADIHLGDYDWTPIGTRSINYLGTFDGQGHKVKGIYINNPGNDYLGLFGSVQGATLRGISVYGTIIGAYYTAGLVGNAEDSTTIDRCANFVDVAGSDVGGIVGASRMSTITNCFNTGHITGYYCGGIAMTDISDIIENVFNVGEIEATGEGGAITSWADDTNFSNAFAVKEYLITDGQTTVTEEQMASGEVAYKLGEAFGQQIGVDPYPVLDGVPVYYDETTDTYYNLATGINDITGADATPDCYFNLQGVSSQTPWRGINIVRMTDGTIRKIVVK